MCILDKNDIKAYIGKFQSVVLSIKKKCTILQWLGDTLLHAPYIVQSYAGGVEVKALTTIASSLYYQLSNKGIKTVQMKDKETKTSNEKI